MCFFCWGAGGREPLPVGESVLALNGVVHRAIWAALGTRCSLAHASRSRSRLAAGQCRPGRAGSARALKLSPSLHPPIWTHLSQWWPTSDGPHSSYI
jgi:hypothetical protein